MAAVNDAQAGAKLFFLDAPGGCGKTFTTNLLLASVRAADAAHGRPLGGVAVAVASSGIAALLMDGGTTAHSRMKIPIELDAESRCNLGAQTQAARLLREASIIVWDEAPMMHKFCYSAVDRLLRDLTKVDQPMGGKVFVMAGDFRQVLPVVPKGTRAQIVAACIKKHASLWPHVTPLRLTENMRVSRLRGQLGAEALQDWASYLLGVGCGETDSDMQVPEDMVVGGEDPKVLIQEVFGAGLGDLSQEDLIGRCILCPKNDGVKLINDAVTTLFPGEACDRYSADSVEDDTHNLYATEVLNGLDPQGMPPHPLISIPPSRLGQRPLPLAPPCSTCTSR